LVAPASRRRSLRLGVAKKSAGETPALLNAVPTKSKTHCNGIRGNKNAVRGSAEITLRRTAIYFYS